jgi:Ca2+-binding RTX toxin-like protein
LGARKRLTSICAVVGISAALGLLTPGVAAARAGNNGGRGVAGDDPPLVVGDGWSPTTDEPPAFFWNGPGQPFNDEGPYTFSSPIATVLSVTDDFQCGDRFRVFDNGVAVGDTSLVPVNVSCLEVGPDAAFANPAYSHGSFLLPAGAHAITIQAIGNPFEGGRGYLRADVVNQTVCANPPPPPAGAIIATPGVDTSGTPGNDVIYGTGGDDRIAGLGGDDLIFGMGGNDKISGGDGNDVICGGSGNDQLVGGNGNDVLSGDAGNDALSGGPGDDRLFGGAGTDQLAGSAGSDTCVPGGDPGDATADCESTG